MEGAGGPICRVGGRLAHAPRSGAQRAEVPARPPARASSSPRRLPPPQEEQFKSAFAKAFTMSQLYVQDRCVRPARSRTTVVARAPASSPVHVRSAPLPPLPPHRSSRLGRGGRRPAPVPLTEYEERRKRRDMEEILEVCAAGFFSSPHGTKRKRMGGGGGRGGRLMFPRRGAWVRCIGSSSRPPDHSQPARTHRPSGVAARPVRRPSGAASSPTPSEPPWSSWACCCRISSTCTRCPPRTG